MGQIGSYTVFTKKDEHEKVWCKYVLTALERSVERLEKPDHAILWKDQLQDEMKRIFNDSKDDLIVDFVENYEQASHMADSCKKDHLSDLQKMKLIDCLSYYSLKA